MAIDLIIADFVLHFLTYQLSLSIAKANLSQMQQTICNSSPYPRTPTQEYSTTVDRLTTGKRNLKTIGPDSNAIIL